VELAARRRHVHLGLFRVADESDEGGVDGGLERSARVLALGQHLEHAAAELRRLGACAGQHFAHALEQLLLADDRHLGDKLAGGGVAKGLLVRKSFHLVEQPVPLPAPQRDLALQLTALLLQRALRRCLLGNDTLGARELNLHRL